MNEYRLYRGISKTIYLVEKSVHVGLKEHVGSFKETSYRCLAFDSAFEANEWILNDLKEGFCSGDERVESSGQIVSTGNPERRSVSISQILRDGQLETIWYSVFSETIDI